jgi:hypothetical protein
MFDWLIRDYEKVVRRLFKSGRRGIIENENREPPIPGVIQVISQIFDADAKRQEAEYMSRAMQRRPPLTDVVESGRRY